MDLKQIPSEHLAEVSYATQQLEARGLLVIPRVWSLGEFSLVIARARHNDGEIGLLEDVSLIYYEKEQWGFRKWDYCPGPGPDDIDFQSESLEMITQVDLNYYFGEPTILNKWVLPVHKHPEWDIARLHRALNTATQISLPQWQSIREEAVANRNRLHPLGTMLQIFACSFNPIAHSEDSNLTLYLRRDLAEAFIVASQDEFLMRQGG